MKRAGIFYLCIVLLCSSQQAHAQFWKNIFRKKEPVRKTIPARKPVVKEREAVKPVKKRHEVKYPETVKKDRYRIDVLVPLYLDELVRDNKVTFKGKTPDKATGGLDFYEGIKLAADTLNSMGYDMDVYIHDIADPFKSPEKLIANNTLDNTDLIIGAVQSQQMPDIAAFTQSHHINFVSALSPSDAEIRNNPYFILMQPTLQTHCEAIVKKVESKHKDDVLLFYRTSLGVDEEAYDYIIDAADREMTKLLCNTMPGRQQLEALLKKDKANIIIMALLDNAYAEKMLTQLYEWFPAYSFEVYGMPSWRTMNALKKPDAFPNTAVYITEPSYYDITTAWAQTVATHYKADFASNKPGELLFRGYEMLYWYAQLLKKYGTVFNEHMNDNSTIPFTKYEILPKWRKDEFYYNENKHVYLLRYQSSSYMIEK